MGTVCAVPALDPLTPWLPGGPMASMDVFEHITESARPFFRQASLHAGAALGLFDAVPPDGGALPIAPTAVAGALELSFPRLRPLLDVLVLEGALEREGDGLRLGRVPSETPSPPAEGCGLLADVLRSDAPLPPPDETQHHELLAELGAAPAGELAGRVTAACGADTALRVADLGCGRGTYARPFLAHAAVTALALVDRPEVVAALPPELCADARTRPLAADLLGDTPLPTADVALLANVVHLLGLQEVDQLLRRVSAALPPGGRVVIKDLAVAEDRSGPPAALYFALNMALYTPHGDVHRTSDLAEALRGAGFERVERWELASSPGSLVLVGTR